MVIHTFGTISNHPMLKATKIMDWIINKDLHVLNDGSATPTSQITSNDSTPDLSLCGRNCSTKTSWSLAQAIGSSDHCQFLSSSTKESDTEHSSQGRPGDVAMALTGPVWSTRLNHECSNFQRSLSFPSISHDSTTSSNLQPHFMSAEPNRVRNLSLESIHTSQRRSAIATVSVVLYIKSGRNGWMLVKKQKLLSAKPRPIAGQPRCMESHLRPQQHTRYQLAQWSHVL